jgi:large subunit ribosomal protein L31
MKAKIHPTYFEDLIITCSCGHSFLAGSTKKEIRTEICSACHPFYTGQQKLVDTAGRVDKFLARVKQAQKIKEKQVKVVDDELEELFEDKTEEAPAAEMVQTEIDIQNIEEEDTPAAKTKPAPKTKPSAKAVVKAPSAKKPVPAAKPAAKTAKPAAKTAKPAAKKGKK